MKKAKKILGRVRISHSYIVDMSNKDMVQEAKDCLYEDLMNAYKYDELAGWIDVEEDKNAKESDIADFLKEENEA